jgi:hypothetical protein
MSLLMVVLALTASGILLYLTDGNLDQGAYNNVMRNWEQYGILTLKGGLVQNPGGYEALTKPWIHPGYSPTCIYPVFLVRRLFAWTGAGTLAFHVALSLAVLLSTWFLLGKSRVAWVAGVAAILCPGYALLPPALDPNPLAILMGFPFVAIVLAQLGKPSLSPRALAVVFLVIAAYTALNWSTAFVHGMVLAYLLVARKIPRRRVGMYVAWAGVSVLLIGSILVRQKLGSGAGGSVGFKDYFASYGWGAGGYGTYLTMGRAVMRVLFVGVVGLLPLLLVCAYMLINRPKSNAMRVWIAFSPLAAGILEICVMRNWLGHHPWITASVFLVGLILSMKLIAERLEESSSAGESRGGGKVLLPAAFLAGCFAYGAVVISLADLHNADAHAVVALLRVHTARSDAIVIMETDLALAGSADTVAGYGDRRVVVLPDLSAVEQVGGRAFLISTSAEIRLPLVARTSPPALLSNPLVQKMLALYSRKIARRFPKNQGLRPGSCYLYELKRDPQVMNERLISQGV